jgi:oligopeptide/dipeptide ABC transporter ATP-binding protein
VDLLLSVRDLRLTLPGQGGRIAPVDGVSFEIARGECVGLVGESGCGKSLTAQTLIGLTRYLPRSKASGEARWRPAAGGAERDLVRLSEAELARLRGRQISMVFQDPLSSLNPLLRVDYQIREVLAKHLGLKGEAAQRRVVELLASVGIPEPEMRARQYPHQLSGGLRQRALLAVALAGDPKLLIADEPTTALDVTVQAQILRELKRLLTKSGMSILFITHDLGVIAQLCDRVMVMYAGRIVESAPTTEFFRNTQHPYSKGLLSSLPSLAAGGQDLSSIPGSPPQPGEFPPGCRFEPRCPVAIDECSRSYPELEGAADHKVSCFVTRKNLVKG